MPFPSPPYPPCPPPFPSDDVVEVEVLTTPTGPSVEAQVRSLTTLSLSLRSTTLVDVLDVDTWREGYVYKHAVEGKSGRVKAYCVHFVGWTEKWDRLIYTPWYRNFCTEDAPDLKVESLRPYGSKVGMWRDNIEVGSLVEVRGPTSSDENPRWHLATVTDLLPPGTTPPPGSLLCPSPPTLPFALPSLTSAPSLIYCRLSYLPPSNHSPVWANVNSEDICSPYTHNSKINAVKRKGMNVSKPSVSQPRARGGKEDEGGRQVQEKAETGGGYPGARAANAAMSGDIKFGCASDAPSLPSLSLHVRGTPVRPSAVGLRNLGNSCFMNTVLQVICRVRGFREYFAYPYKNDLLNPSNPSSTGGRLATAFSDFLRLFYSNRYAVVSPSRLRSLCSEYSDDLRSSKGQHDAAEFMQQIVFQLLHEDLNTAKGKLEVGGGDDANYQTFPRDVNEQRVEDVKTDASFVTTKFRSYFANRTTCTVCKTESVKYEGFTTLSLAVPFKAGGCSVTLSECIDNFENPESVSGIDCQVCGCRVVKNTRNNIHVCSDVVVVQLKRFSWDGVKNTAPVTFPLSMKLGEQTEHQRGEYGLIGVVNHLGRNLQNGHYTANAIVEGMEWFHFNDEKVDRLEPTTCANKNAYLLVYQRSTKGDCGRRGGEKKKPLSESRGAAVATGLMAAMLV